MTTQYTPILKLALPVQGELSGTWGDTVNDNITSMVEEAIAGRSVINSWTANSHTLTTADGTTAESRAMMLEFTDTGVALTGAGTVICPAASKVYICKNSSGQVVTIKTSGGTGVAVPNGATTFVFCDGTNVEECVTNIVDVTVSGTITLASGVSVSAILDEDNMASDSATALATQQSIKAYVDSQVGTVDTLAEVLANGNTSGATDLVIDSGQVLTTNTINETTAASGVTIDSVLLKDDGVNATNLEITNLKANDGTSAGSIANSTGVVTLASSVLTTTDINGGTIDGTVIGGSSAAAGSFTTISASGEIAANGGVAFGDNDKATFGASDDLEIYHDGSNSWVADKGTGDLYVATNGHSLYLYDQANAKTMAQFVAGGASRLHYDNAIKIATTSTGIDVTGTVTADGLNLDGNIQGDTGQNMQVSAGAGTGDKLDLRAGDDVRIYVDGATSHKLAANFANNGDISFYEDTGTTAKFFWDASAESLGIGTTSPLYNVDLLASRAVSMIRTNDTTSPTLGLFVNSGSNGVGTISVDNGGHMTFDTGASGAGQQERMRIDSSGTLILSGNGGSTTNSIDISYNGASGQGSFNVDSSSGNTYLTFGTSSSGSLSEAARIDSSGNLLVGKTSADYTTAGVMVEGDGTVSSVKSGVTGVFNRLTSDGDIVQFRKDGTTVGSIGATSNNIYIGRDDTALYVSATTNSITPVSITTGSAVESNGNIDLGRSSARFKDLYLSGGVYLGGTGAANHLDDYEEGTWTPVDNSGAGLTWAAYSGTYTKVGDTVFISLQLSFPSTVDATAISIGGLPFTSSATTGKRGGLQPAYNTGTNAQGALIDINATTFRIKAGLDQSTNLTNAQMSGAVTYWEGFYRV